MSCISCKKPFTSENVYSQAGWRETKISQMCEKCFDACTLPEDDGSEPDENYVNQDPDRSLYHNDNEDSEGYREDGCPWIYTE